MATQTMGRILMAKFKPTTKQWDGNQPGFHAKAFHLVLNKYQRNDSLDAHQDHSITYDGRNPIASLSYGRGRSKERVGGRYTTTHMHRPAVTPCVRTHTV